MPNRTAWSEEDVERLKANWGKSSSGYMSKHLFEGRFSRNSILGKAYRIGLPRLTEVPKIQAPKPERKPPMPKPDVLAPVAVGLINDFPDRQSDSTCRYPHDLPEGGWQLCGVSTEGGPWCSFHQKLCCTKPNPPRYNDLNRTALAAKTFR